MPESEINGSEDNSLQEPLAFPRPRKEKKAEIRITYYTDPVCMWSFAFEPHWIRLIENLAHQINFDVKMGGLVYPGTSSPYTAKESAMALKNEIQDKTGVSISPALWEKHQLQSSYPACISFYSSIDESFAKRVKFLRRLRQEYLLRGNYFMIESDFFEILKTSKIDLERFHHYWKSGIAYREFLIGLASNNAQGIHSFPTLKISRPGQSPVFFHGFHNFYRIQHILSSAFPELVWIPLPDFEYILSFYQPLTAYEIVQLFDLTPETLRAFLKAEKITPKTKTVNGIKLFYHPETVI
jgi:protein-disulfide isomerase-like protein with CxxC motif